MEKNKKYNIIGVIVLFILAIMSFRILFGGKINPALFKAENIDSISLYSFSTEKRYSIVNTDDFNKICSLLGKSKQIFVSKPNLGDLILRILFFKKGENAPYEILITKNYPEGLLLNKLNSFYKNDSLINTLSSYMPFDSNYVHKELTY